MRVLIQQGNLCKEIEMSTGLLACLSMSSVVVLDKD